MTPKWIDGLLRARQFTEDNAKAELATAQRHLHRTRAQLRFDSERLETMNYPGAEAHAISFVASAVALQAGVRRHDLVDAAVSRRSAEELAERALAAERAKEAAAAQRATDEIAAAVFRRAHIEDPSLDSTDTTDGEGAS